MMLPKLKRMLTAVILVVCLELTSPGESVKLPEVFPRNFTIGAALSEQKYCDELEKSIEEINQDGTALPPGISLTLNASCVTMNSNPIVTAEMVCESLIGHNVYIAIAGHDKEDELSPMSLSFTCGFYTIPIIGISSRASSFSDKNVHAMFLRTVAPYSEQADIWVEMLQDLKFKLVIFLHSTNQEGRAMLNKFQNKLGNKDVAIEMEKNFPYTAGQSDFTEVLTTAKKLTSRVILLYASAEDAEKIYRDAASLEMTGENYAWIVTEQSLEPNNTPIGVLGLQLNYSKDEKRHLHYGVKIIAKAITEMVDYGVNLTAAPGSCEIESNDLFYESGSEIFRSLISQKLTPKESQSGLVQFNEVGDRIYSHYQVYNKQAQGLVPVGTYGKDRELRMDSNIIIWPGDAQTKPKGIEISTHLKIVTEPSEPFIYAKPMEGDQCEPLESSKTVPCPRINKTADKDIFEKYCCWGYCMDLLEELAKKVNFTYEVRLSQDRVFGSKRTSQGSKEWNGMIGELVRGDADMIVAPLTINPERALAIDFTKPFKYQGMTILVQKTVKDSSLASFLQPFQDTLWILVGLSVHVVALVLYLLDRFSPFGRFKLAKSDDTEEDALNLSGAVWFAWGVLLNSGIGEGTPRSFSARVLGMVWAGFAMIIVASYTANLAAFLVLDRPVASISGIDDARLRNPQDDFKYTTVRDSAVAMYFKRQVELSTMYRTMEQNFTSTDKEAIQAIKNGDLQAFIWDSSRLEHEAANDCDLVTAGELFGRSGYGIGLTKGSHWTEEISLQILNFHETGYMEKLDNEWILVSDKECPERDPSPATLGLTNMAGVFMMVAGGIVAGVFLIFIEIAYKRHRGLKEKELELAKTAADRWRGNIEKRRTLRRTLLLQQEERNKAKNGTTDSPAHTVRAVSDSPAHTRLTQCSPTNVPPGYQPVATNMKCSQLPV